MKKALLICAPMALCANAQAQSNVTLYGSLDLGPAFISNLGGVTSKRLVGGTTQPDRMGFRGNEDLGDGLSTVFQLETGLAPETGTQVNPTKFFNREARVGLVSKTWGGIAMGRLTDVMFDYVGRLSNGYNLFNFSAFHPGNFDGLANTNAFDNAIKYTTPNFSGAEGELEVAAGEGGGRSTAAGFNYASGPLRASIAYVRRNLAALDIAGKVGIRQTLGRTFTPGVAITLDKTETLGAGLVYSFGALSMNAAYTQTEMDLGSASTKPKNYDLGATYRFTDVNWLNAGVSNSRFDSVHWNTYSLEELYWLSKRTQIYAEATLQNASGGGVAAMNGVGLSSTNRQTIYSVGMHHSF